MERKINNLSICYLLFLILLFLSGSLSGAISDLVQYFAYILPFALGLYFMRDEEPCEENYGKDVGRQKCRCNGQSCGRL